jgi:hypothetical protein
MKREYSDWLQGNFEAGTRTTQLSQARRLEEAYGDLDMHYERDGFASLLADLAYSTADKADGKPNPSRIVIEGNKLYDSLAHLRSALGYYRRFRVAHAGPEQGTEWPALEAMRVAFLERCSDFTDFTQTKGLYYDKERAYKDVYLLEAQKILESPAGREFEPLGSAFLDLIKATNFVGWRAYVEIEKSIETRKAIAVSLGTMLLSTDEVPQAVAMAASYIHPFLQGGTMGNPAFGQIRTLVTSAMALVRPAGAISVKTQMVQRAVKALTGKPVFKNAVLSADEYQSFLALALRIKDQMTAWNWKPRDLWDVQGFLWVAIDDDYAKEPRVGDDDLREEDNVLAEKKKHPLNQILYGPPGTGKTWATARLAVEICHGFAPDSRAETMRLYNELVSNNRVAFTTFHQSIGYEEFIEGLRPVTGQDDSEGSSGGFRLKPFKGIFREICVLAEQARKRGGAAGYFDFTGRQFFKMSLGRAQTESYIYDAAIKGNYIILGWGRDIDWSDPKYDDQQEVVKKWREIEPDASGNSGNISQLWRFRSMMRKGDIVIVSDGNLRFRAVGEITGDYQFQPGDEGGNHRRSVRWLAVFEESLPIETIYNDRLSQMSCYLLTRDKLKLDALSRLIATEASITVKEKETGSVFQAKYDLMMRDLVKEYGEGSVITRPQLLAVVDKNRAIYPHPASLEKNSANKVARGRYVITALGNPEQLRDKIIQSEGGEKTDDTEAAPDAFVLIIDEINRANVSKVLGELITLLEPDKRLGEPNALTAKLPYSNDIFGVPNNLYIIGTMNTADRSIALLDTALRRRFHFTEMLPDYTCLDRTMEGVHLGHLLTSVNRRVEWLFDRDHQIGHAFFVDVQDKADLDIVMKEKVIPLLAEYFYEDWEKIRAVLNDRNEGFITVEKLKPPPMLRQDNEERTRYSIAKIDIPLAAYFAAVEDA